VRSQKAISGGRRSRKPPPYLTQKPPRPLCKIRNKVRYPSEAEAEVALVKIRASGPKKPGGHIPLRSYACSYCNGWHLTSWEKNP
jgi:hypothetical protein